MINQVEVYVKSQRKWITSHLCYWKKDEFTQLCYQLWAGNEILDYLRKHRNLGLLEGIEQFRRMMDNYSCRSKSICFSVAYDVATDILDTLIKEG